MSAAAIRGVVRRLGPSTPSIDPPPDSDLVAAFVARRDPDAFAALVDRHGPTVLGVCRRVLGNAHDAEDAFQAVFLVLARRVGAVRPPGAVGGWLYGVAVRTANKARVAMARRRRREMIAATNSASRDQKRQCEDSRVEAELRAALDEEIGKLPEPLRAVVVLCDLHGRTRADAAAELRSPEGTIAARLHRARKKLGEALARRGLALPAAGLTTLLVPAAVTASAARSAVAAALGSATPAVLALAREVTRSMTSTTHAVALGAITLLAGGLLAAGSIHRSDQSEPPSPATQPQQVELKVDQPRPSTPWKEAKVLEMDGWLAGSVVYSGDGKVLFIGGTSGGGHVRAFSIDGFELLWEYKGLDQFSALALSPDGKTLAVTVKDGIQFLDAGTGKAGDKLEEMGSEPVAAAYFPDVPVKAGEDSFTSRKVIFGNARGYFVKTWLAWPQVSTIKTSTVPEGKEPADAHAVPLAVSPDGKRVVVTGPIDRDTGKNVLWAWSAGSGEANKLLEGHKAVVTCAAWSKDGKTIVTGDAEGIVIAWDGETFKEKSRRRFGPRIAAVAISPDGKHLAAAVASLMPASNKTEAYSEAVFVWLSVNPPENLKPLFSHDAGGPFKGVASLAFAPDGRTLAVAFANFTHLNRLGELVGKVRVFSLAAEEPKPGTPTDYVSRVEFSPDGKRYLVVSGKGIRVHDSANGKQLWQAPGEAARFTADGRTICVIGEKITDRDAATGAAAPTTHPRPKSKWDWQRVAFAPDGKRYAAHTGLEARVYDTASGFEPLRLDDQTDQIRAGTTSAVTGKELFWSPDGTRVAAVGVQIQGGPFGFTTMGAAVWDVETGNRLHVFGANLEVPETFAFSADGKLLAATFQDRVVLYDAKTFKEVRNLGDYPYATALAFSPDGKMLAAGIRLPIRPGGDVQDVRKWNYHTQVRLIDAETGKTVRAFDGFEGKDHPMEATRLPVTALAFSADGKKLIAGTGLTSVVPVYWGVVAHPNDLPKAGEVKLFDLDAIVLPERKP